MKKLIVAFLAMSLASCATVRENVNCENAKTTHDTLSLALLVTNDKLSRDTIIRAIAALEVACPYIRTLPNDL